MFQKLFGRTFVYAFSIMLATSLLSAATVFTPVAYAAALWFLVVVMAALVVWRLDIAVLAVFGELIVGSQGHLFATHVHGFTLSIRLVFFLLVFTALTIRLIRQKRIRDIAKQPGRWWLCALIMIILGGAAYGIARGNAVADVFFDANGFLFLGLTLVLAPQLRELIGLDRLAQVLLAGIFFLGLQAAMILALFSHQYAIDPSLYRWLRNTRTVEITTYAKNFYRIFSQSQIYSMFGFFTALAAFPFVREQKLVRFVLLPSLAVTSMTLLLSFSRSMWAAWIITGIVVIIWFLVYYGWRWKTIGLSVFAAAGLLIADFLVISFLANYPYLWNRPGGQATFSLFSDRGTTRDVAAASRYDQIQPLLRAIAKNPVFGLGFGTQITYVTHDPRIVAATGGVRTTFSFELGYLDFLLKIGIVGVVVLLGWIMSLLRALWNRFRNAVLPAERILYLSLFFSVFALLITHASTPYLNHPLGLGLLTLAAGCTAFGKDAHRPKKQEA